MRVPGSLLAALAVVLAVPAAPAGAAGWSLPATLAPGGHPALGVDAQGDSVVAWGDDQGSLSASEMPFDGPFGPPQPLTGGGGDGASTLPVLAVGPRGDVVAAALLGGDPPDLDASLRAPGGLFGPLRPVARRVNFTTTTDLQVAVDHRGGAVAVWGVLAPNGLAPGGVMAAVRRPGAGGFGPAHRLAGRGSGLPRVAMNAGGEGYVVWERPHSVAGVTVSRAGHFATTQGLSQGGEDAGVPALGIDPRGNVLVAWVRTTGRTRNRIGRHAIAVSERLRSGRILRRGVVSRQGVNAQAPRVALTDDGSAAVAYLNGSDGLSGEGGRLELATRVRRGAFRRGRPVTGRRTHVLDLDLRTDGQGRLIAAWNQGVPGMSVGGEELRRAAVALGTIRAGLGRPVTLSTTAEDVDFNFAVHAVRTRAGGALAVWSATGTDFSAPESENIRYSLLTG